METDPPRDRIAVANQKTRPDIADTSVMEDLAACTIEIYCQVAGQFDQSRSRELFEKPWLEAFQQPLPKGGRVLDVGCGTGAPIAAYLISQGFQVTGMDAAAPMLEIARHRFPAADWVVGDMRSPLPDEQFHGIVAWNSFFHLTEEEQRIALKRFASALRPKGRLLMTVGPAAGRAVGQVGGKWVFHASLSLSVYAEVLISLGMTVLTFVPEDSSCRGHSVLLAEKI